jgi:hypothetical protein
METPSTIANVSAGKSIFFVLWATDKQGNPKYKLKRKKKVLVVKLLKVIVTIKPTKRGKRCYQCCCFGLSRGHSGQLACVIIFELQVLCYLLHSIDRSQKTHRW